MTGNLRKDVDELYDNNIMLRKELTYLLSHLSQDNIPYYKNADGLTLFQLDGINPEAEFWSPNMWCNSDMCIYDSTTKLPRFISGATIEASDSAVFMGQKSMKIPVGVTAIYTPEVTLTASTINPVWLSPISSTMYLAFYAKFTGGVDDTLTVEIYNQTAGANLTITDAEGNSGASLTFTRGDWDDKYVYVWFTPGASTDIRPKITNNSATLDLYVNAPQVCADINDHYPQPYIRGKFSVGDQNGKSIELMTIQSIYVQDDEPLEAVVKDLWLETDNWSRYCKKIVTGETILVLSDNEFIVCDGTFTLTLHAGTQAGVVKKIYNIGSGLITVAGTINGETNMLLYPNESVELITDGTNWRC
jgi:hypothetical protein